MNFLFCLLIILFAEFARETNAKKPFCLAECWNSAHLCDKACMDQPDKSSKTVMTCENTCKTDLEKCVANGCKPKDKPAPAVKPKKGSCKVLCWEKARECHEACKTDKDQSSKTVLNCAHDCNGNLDKCVNVDCFKIIRIEP